MLRQRIQENTISPRRTLLCIGPVSQNCIDAVIELAQVHQFPLTLIASRRQVDAKTFGGGYVGFSSTFDYVAYVRQKDPQGKVILARDHAGPWQNEDIQLNLDEAMMSAKKSLKVDIESGIQIIHLDASIDPRGSPRVEEILDRVFELHRFCYDHAHRVNKEVEFEFGPFFQDSIDDLSQIEFVLKQVTDHCRKNKFKLPLYLVVNTGTKVMECGNADSYESMICSENGVLRDKLMAMAGLCERYQVFLKEHNSDYLSDQAILAHPALGIHSANIAPELGVIETVELLELLQKNGRQDLYEEFISLAVDSLKWQKWMLPQTKPSREYLAKIAGHYVYTHLQGVNIRKELQQTLSKQGIELEDHFRKRIRLRIEQYLRYFGLMNVEVGWSQNQ